VSSSRQDWITSEHPSSRALQNGHLHLHLSRMRLRRLSQRLSRRPSLSRRKPVCRQRARPNRRRKKINPHLLSACHQTPVQTVRTSRATSACTNLHDVPWLSSIQALERKQGLTGLTPKRGLIAAQPIERLGWQVGQANKGVGEIAGLVSKCVGRWCASINASGDPRVTRVIGLLTSKFGTGRLGYSWSQVVVNRADLNCILGF
jgi:hypothetical protein